MTTRRETLLKIAGLAGGPVFLAGCNMDAVRRAEAQLGDRMRRPGTGIQFSGLPEVVKVMVLATYPATPQQTQVAEQRARKAVAVIAKREGKKKVAKLDRGGNPDARGTVVIDSTPAKEAASDIQVAAAVLQANSGTSIIAVDTTPDKRLQGDGTVMLWNTQTQRFVGNNVYDISSPPAKGQVAQWGSTTARYVGSGTF
ncbi:MAG TPA: hypothetical protein VLE43_12325 [Candidatus Saccharimonadia bacterium]|nr:hypothetical protein [Candidatus Saccharimonadia bacterium]